MQAESISRSRPSGPVIVDAGWRDIGALYRLEKLCFPRDSWPLIDIILVLLLPGVGIVWATMALRYHYVVDVVASAGLLPVVIFAGTAFHRWAEGDTGPDPEPNSSSAS